MSRLERRIRAKMERTTRHPRVHRNEEYFRKKDDVFDKNILDSMDILPPEAKAFALKYGVPVFLEAARCLENVSTPRTRTGIFCGSCKVYELPVVHVATFDEEPVELPEGTRMCLHCPICDARLHPDFHLAEEDD